MCYMLMLGIGQEFFPKFGKEIHLDDRTIGLLQTISMFVATSVQQFSVLAVLRARSYQRIVWTSAAFQGLMLLFLAPVAFAASSAPDVPASKPVIAAIFAILSGYYIGSFFGGPAWMTMMSNAIPNRVMPKYIGRRTLILHLALTVGLLVSGYALSKMETPAAALRTLGVMFIAAGIARFLSAFYLSRYSQPPFDPPILVPPREVIRRIRFSPDGKALTFLVVMQAAMWVAYPFFSTYILHALKHRAPTTATTGPAHDQTFIFATLIAAFYVGKMIAPEVAGRAVHRFGVLPVTWVSAIALIPVPLLFLFSGDQWALLTGQFISGAALAAFELCTFILQVEHVPVRERVSVVSTFNFGLYTAGFLGSALGGYLLTDDATASTYAAAFIASAILRLASLALLARVPRAGLELESDLLAAAPGPGGEAPTLNIVHKR